MPSLLLRLIKTDDRAWLHESMVWLCGFVRPRGLAVARLLALAS